MAFTILNNTAAQMTLGELNKNISKVGKQLAKLSTGEKISGGGGAAEYAISEKMRELIRSLGQNERNVQTGVSLLKVAEGGVTEQLELLKTVKEKVLDAANDSNTDADRAIIQKEIDQCFKQMEDIAQTTNYNGRRLLAGDATAVQNQKQHRLALYYGDYKWRELDEAQLIKNTDAKLIADNYPVLDDLEGPFDVFNALKPVKSPVAISVLGISENSDENKFSGGVDGDPKIITMNLSSNYSTPQELDGKGFILGRTKYVFSTDPNKKYKEHTVINISGATSMADVASAAKQVVGNNSIYSVEANGNSLVFTTIDNSALSSVINNYPGISGSSRAASTETVTIPGSDAVYGNKTKTLDVTSTNFSDLPKTLSGGSNGVAPTYETILVPKDNGGDVDKKIEYEEKQVEVDPGTPGKRASATVDLSAATAGSTVKLHGKSDVYLQFVEGKDSYEFIKGDDDSNTNPQIVRVGINYRGSVPAAGLVVDLSKGLSNVVVTDGDSYGGAKGNNYSIEAVSSNINYSITEETQPAGKDRTETINYSRITPLNLSGVTTVESATDATYATFDMNFSDTDDIESVIAELYGKSLNFSYGTISFDDYETSPSVTLTAMSTYRLNLNDLRKLSKTKGNNVEALQDFLKDSLSPYTATPTDTGLKIRAKNIGEPGNSEKIAAREAGRLRYTDIDFSNKSPSSLIDKGFRVYCATDENEWWNFIFTGEQDPEFEASKPVGKDGKNEIKTIRIDISGCQNGGDVVRAFYEQAEPILSGASSKFNHNLRVEANPNTATLRLYDKRTNELTSVQYDHLMGKGGGLDETKGWWKIADGVIDDVEAYREEIWKEEEYTASVIAKDFVIHDGPHANRRIFLKLPQTTLDRVLDYDKSENIAEDFNVMTKEMRDKLLGVRQNPEGDDKEPNGILDKGILYLTNANVLIGSEIQRLKLSENNIVNKIETAKASESVIRDADMAKEMTEYTKYNILAQSAQAMLSQANQNSSSVLSLLA